MPNRLKRTETRVKRKEIDRTKLSNKNRIKPDLVKIKRRPPRPLKKGKRYDR